MIGPLARLALSSSLAAALAVGFALAAEPTPAASASSPARANEAHPKPGVIGNVDEQELQKKDAADAVIKSDPAPVSKEAIKRQDKAKAVQTGNDATLRDLPSPANKGTE